MSKNPLSEKLAKGVRQARQPQSGETAPVSQKPQPVLSSPPPKVAPAAPAYSPPPPAPAPKPQASASRKAEGPWADLHPRRVWPD